MKTLTKAHFLMDIFYRNYPHLDKHDADIQCVEDILLFIVEYFSTLDSNGEYIILCEDIMKLVGDLRTLREPSIGHCRRDLDAL